MRKTTRKITITEWILEDKDVSVIKDCLNYCYHRATQHKKFSVKHFDDIQRLRREFGITRNYD